MRLIHRRDFLSYRSLVPRPNGTETLDQNLVTQSGSDFLERWKNDAVFFFSRNCRNDVIARVIYQAMVVFFFCVKYNRKNICPKVVANSVFWLFENELL